MQDVEASFRVGGMVLYVVVVIELEVSCEDSLTNFSEGSSAGLFGAISSYQQSLKSQDMSQYWPALTGISGELTSDSLVGKDASSAGL